MSIIPIDDVETLYRRIRHVEGLYVVQANGTVRVSSAAFSDPLFRPSVDRAELLHNDPKKAQRDPSDGVVSIVAHEVRSIDTVVQNDKDGKIVQAFDVDIEHVPVQDHPTLPDNLAHAEIFTIPSCPNKSVFRKLAERLAQLANERRWEIELSSLSK